MFKLSTAPAGMPCRVRLIHDIDSAPGLRRQLEEIGFHAGAPVLVIARGWPGGDPLAVRIGESTFALRAAEAECIEVETFT